MRIRTKSRAATWTASDIPPQHGRRFVITGAGGGLGREMTRRLAAAGAHVTMAVRTPGTVEEFARSVPGQVDVRRVDMADLASVRSFAEGTERVDVLINNAGVMGVPFQRTVDGFEMQIGTNYLGHFALTNLLLPRITDRVVSVGSAAHRSGFFDVDDLNWGRRAYHRYGAYAQSKVATLLFSGELQRRLTAQGSTLRSVAAHPGYSATGIQGRTEIPVFTRISDFGNRFAGMKPEQGARPLLFAATLDLPGNSYVGPDRLFEMRGRPTLVGRSRTASDPDLAKVLWAKSESLTGVCFPG